MAALLQPTSPVRLLHIEDSEPDHVLAMAQLRRAGLRVDATRVETRDEFRRALARPWDVVLSDYNLPGFTGIEALQLLRATGRALPFILVSGEIGEDTAVEAMRNGANDYLLKNNLARLAPAVEQAISAAETLRAKRQADRELQASQKRLSELAQHLQTSVEGERHAIAREIHDDVGGSLTALKFDLDWIGRRVTQPEVRQRVLSALDTVTHAIEASQRIMHNLRPAILEQGLVPALQWMASRFERRSGVTCVFRTSHDKPALPAGVPLVAYRTAQEALTNISKHAHATRVSIDLSLARGVLSLEISDNGRGLSSADLGKAQSFGIRGLRERALTVGGWIDLSSSASGTTVILSVPLDNAPREPEPRARDNEEHDPSAWGSL
ncbi:MAG: response regulator [Rubrivivax sp.]